jgi:hypothetical protein
MILEAPEAIASFVGRLLQLGLEVWLIGSRANQTSTEASDWDLLVFGSQQLLESLAREAPIAGVDLLVVFDGEQFKSPWPRPEDGHFKCGSLTRWKWTKLSDDAATYEGSKWIDDETWDTSRKRAMRVRRCRMAG